MENSRPDDPPTCTKLLNPWVLALAIPVAILLVGHLITRSIEASKLDSEYVKVALGVINVAAPTPDSKQPDLSEEQLALRQWAIRLLRSKSPEKFSDAEQTALLKLRGRFASLEWESPFGPLRMIFGQPSTFAQPSTGGKINPSEKTGERSRIGFDVGTEF